jgi:hypothetical protein
MEITSENFYELSQLCDEFGCRDLGDRVTQFREAAGATIPRAEFLAAIARISQLEQDRQADAALIASLRAQLQPEWPRLDSEILSEFPREILGDFQGKIFKLLWRGTRDGVTAPEFHLLCDGHSNTVTVILDVRGNVFGGFTPIAWGSTNAYIEDRTGHSFLFTLKNPSGVGARRFPLKDASKAIYRGAVYGPTFGYGHDILFLHNTVASYTNLGTNYVNNTGLDGKTVFTGASNFEVREVEVFEIED